jgi:hypothetical protein
MVSTGGLQVIIGEVVIEASIFGGGDAAARPVRAGEAPGYQDVGRRSVRHNEHDPDGKLPPKERAILIRNAARCLSARLNAAKARKRAVRSA